MTDLAVKAMWSAIRKLKHPPVSKEDIEDMLQEARVAIWQCTGKPEAYRFAAARYAVTGWFMRYILGWKQHSKRPSAEVWDRSKTVELLDGDQMIVDEPRGPLPDDLLQDLEEIIYTASKGRGKRTRLAARRTAQAINLAVQGYPPDGIAIELGVSRETAYNYLRRARKVLNEML